jgi:basic membrane lipoprotein Med (substrate-binding protein (PBP1-ABC) superfamily)
MKKFTLLLSVLVVLAVAMPALSIQAQEEPIRVAVVMPSTANDLAFSQSMTDALAAIQEELGEDAFEYVYSENMFVALRDYASEGYDLVIAHGSQYGSSLLDIAPEFPDTAFAWGTTVDTYSEEGITNVYAYEARSEQGAFVMGVIAAMLTESEVIGIIGPIETGDAKLYVDGFTAGVAYEDEYIEVLVNYIESFNDLALAAAAAETMLAEDADILTGTAQMVPGAVQKAKEAEALWFGTQANQTSLAPEIVVASQVYDWTVALMPIIEDVMAGELEGEAFALTLENGGLVIEYNEEFGLEDYAGVVEAAEAMTEAIIAGDISFEIDEDGVLTVVEAEDE